LSGGGAKGSVEELLVAETVLELALKAADGDEVLRCARVLVRGAGEGRQQAGGQISQLRDVLGFQVR
jgi:hypothetical protein